MKKLFSAVLLLLIAVPAYAGRTDCPASKILNIQIEGKKILYVQEGASWRSLGYVGRGDGTEERYSALLAAQATGFKVMVGYPVDDFDCSKTNYVTNASIVRTYNN